MGQETAERISGAWEKWLNLHFIRTKKSAMVKNHLTRAVKYLPAIETRATISDGRKIMATYQVAEGIHNSGIHLAAMMAHSCVS